MPARARQNVQHRANALAAELPRRRQPSVIAGPASSRWYSAPADGRSSGLGLAPQCSCPLYPTPQCFKPAISGGNASGSQDCYFHNLGSSREQFKGLQNLLTEIANRTRASEKASGSAFSPAKVDNDDYLL